MGRVGGWGKRVWRKVAVLVGWGGGVVWWRGIEIGGWVRDRKGMLRVCVGWFGFDVGSWAVW